MEAMALAGEPEEIIQRFHWCGCNARIQRAQEDGSLRVVSFRCKHRLCQRCASTTALRMADNLGDAINHNPRSFSMLTLTLKHSDDNLVKMKQRLLKAFKKLRQQRTWLDRVRGGYVFFQAHRSRRDNRWHAHLHALIWNRYLPHWWLSAEWERITGDSNNVLIERIRDGQKAARECCRYVASPLGKKITGDVFDIADVLLATKNNRLAQKFGIWPGPSASSKRDVQDDRTWTDEGRLGDVIFRAHNGDEDAAKLLAELMRVSTPQNGPPDLFHLPLCAPFN